MYSLSVAQWILVCVCGVLIGASKTGVLGAGILAVPLMAAVFPAKESTGVLLPLLCMADIMGVAFYRRHAVWRVLLRIMPCAAVGIVGGWLLMRHTSNVQLRPMIGVTVLVMIALNIGLNVMKKRVVHTNLAAAVAVGLLAGFTTMTANAAGPVMTLYLLLLGLDKNRLVGTAAWYFFVLNLFKVPFSAQLGLITWHSLALNLMLTPAIVAGGLGGYALVKRMPQKFFEALMQVLAAAGAAYLIVGA